jgi:DNA-directed RNA polymerase sigma subunit (sigma70/sigma32)
MTLGQRNYNIERAYLAGASLREVAAKFGVSYERVRQILAERGVQTRSSAKRKQDGALRSFTASCNS